MSDLRQAAEMALEALSSCEENSWSVSFDGVLVEQALDALRQALAEPEKSQTAGYAKKIEQLIKERDLKREWVGLTKNEVDVWKLPESPTVFEFCQFVEAKLKELNT